MTTKISQNSNTTKCAECPCDTNTKQHNILSGLFATVLIVSSSILILVATLRGSIWLLG